MRIILEEAQITVLKKIIAKNGANNPENPNKLTKNLNNKVLLELHRQQITNKIITNVSYNIITE